MSTVSQPFRPHSLGPDLHASEADVESILLSTEQIQARVAEMGAQISRDYEGREPVFISVLVGAFMFTSDLLRHVTVPCSLDFMAISSYGQESRSSGVVRVMKDLDESIESKHVIILEDIIDTGLTLNYLLDNLRNRNAASVRVAALLDKPSRRLTDVKVDYIGFEVPDEFVVGYGLDFAQRYRNFPYVGVLRPEVYGGK
ncbi:hypoxanthine phosphoribosyltransferase [Abditibacterium utsteinense]|uniref:Hypoxanthine phosphoribosyltransferase n=1 Tax=Abditibacterium utsteinense TaxID=1960156 RepID=A0A2S8SNZ9_9BACT|nr:hypoxanthine phosphoribosyltransferase [Abditibacterium utsteinense]PQV62525.1 hypoxanthine phosphoribosyltransferase [Abditibacterium utsteinense]